MPEGKGLAPICGQERCGRLPPHTPHPTSPLHPEPWEVTHCGWGQCGPSQTPSTANPSGSPALRPAGTQRPQCLWRDAVLGPLRLGCPPPSLGTRQGWQDLFSAFSDSTGQLVLPSGCAGHARHHLEGSALTPGTVCQLQRAWQPLGWAMHVLHTPHPSPHPTPTLRKRGDSSRLLGPTNKDPVGIFPGVFGPSWGIVCVWYILGWGEPTRVLR